MKPKKGQTTQIRPYEGDLEIAKTISENTGIDVVTILSLAMSAGLKAIKANDWNMPTPLSMKVVPKPITGIPGEPIQYPQKVEQVSLAEESPAGYKVKKQNRRLNELPEHKPK